MKTTDGSRTLFYKVFDTCEAPPVDVTDKFPTERFVEYVNHDPTDASFNGGEALLEIYYDPGMSQPVGENPDATIKVWDISKKFEDNQKHRIGYTVYVGKPAEQDWQLIPQIVYDTFVDVCKQDILLRSVVC